MNKREIAPVDNTPVASGTLGEAVAQIMRPVMEAIGEMLKGNAEALERLAATQSIQNDRLEALEKQIRLNTPITTKQAGYINQAIRAKARELLDKKGVRDDRKAETKLGSAIRRDVLSRYGVGGVREIPKHEYPVAMAQIDMWNNALILRDVVREVRAREEKDMACAQPSAGVDDQQAYEAGCDQPRERAVRADMEG